MREAITIAFGPALGQCNLVYLSDRMQFIQSDKYNKLMKIIKDKERRPNGLDAMVELGSLKTSAICVRFASVWLFEGPLARPTIRS